MPAYFFGTGDLFLSRTDVANAAPIKVGTIQDVSVDFSGDVVELFGGDQFAAAVARGQQKITGKASIGATQSALLAGLYFGADKSAGNTTVSSNETHSVPASSPYTVTVINSATFAEDLGVINGTTGDSLDKVASAPASGQYSVSNGVYTFASGASGADMMLSYAYTVPSTGSNFTVTNQPLGTNPTFSMVLYSRDPKTTTNRAYLKLHACVATKLSLPYKQKDFLVQDFEFSASANAAGNVVTWGFTGSN